MESLNEVFTSNFYSMRLIPPGYEGVSIAIGSPKFFNGRKETCFMPTWDLVNKYKNGEIDDNEYIKSYLDLLLDRKQEIFDVIERLKKDKVVYLCHEPRGKFCHRHIVSKVLTEFGFKCSEL